MLTAPLGPFDPAELLSLRDSALPCFFLDCPGTMTRQGWGLSILGFDPVALFQSSGRTARMTEHGRTTVRDGDPLLLLQGFLNSTGFSPPGLHTTPLSSVPFTGGVVGYVSYDLKNWIDGLPSRKGYAPLYPEISLMCMDSVIYMEHGKAWAVAGEKTALSRILERTEEVLRRRDKEDAAFHRSFPLPPGEIVTFMDKRSYRGKVRRIKDYLLSGDVYQVNLTYPVVFPFAGDPFALYSALRTQACAPMGAYLNFGDMAVISASPERFFRVRGSKIDTWPMKGTGPRGRNPREDRASKERLRKSPKDRAENLMIVDLMRNDLGKICRWGSVHVDKLFAVKSYETIHQMISRVSGVLREDVQVHEIFRAVFPGGSVTGAPKIRAMEIIDELEEESRGIYTGGIGYVGFNGDMDMAMAIRTLVVKDGEARYSVGGGIVADSEPEEEYQETLTKAEILLRALSTRQAGPDVP